MFFVLKNIWQEKYWVSGLGLGSRILKVSVLNGQVSVLVSNGQVSNDEVSVLVSLSNYEAETPSLAHITKLTAEVFLMLSDNFPN